MQARLLLLGPVALETIVHILQCGATRGEHYLFLINKAKAASL
jgi:hypothetical protein